MIRRNHLLRVTQEWLEIWLCGALFLFSLYIHWPGFMSFDSFIQFRQALAGVYTGWHPPVMSFVWHYSNKLIFGPGGMLIFHNLMFFIGLALWAKTLPVQHSTRALFIVALAASPAVFTQLGVIWKDV